MTEYLYVSWAGAGRGTAVRAAVEEARDAEARFTFLAVLDESFDDIDESMTEMVIDELTWLIRAQLNLVCRQLNAEHLVTRILARRGPLHEVLSAAAGESSAEVALLGAPVPLDSDAIAKLQDHIGIPVRTVGPEQP
jgi:hypothetical protein